MKKILILCLVIIGTLQFTDISLVSAACEFNNGKDANITDMVNGCMENTTVVQVEGKGLVEDGFKTKIQDWTNNIALFLALLSVGSIIYGGLMMTLSVGEDEKIKKAKDIIKWALVGFLGVVLATTIVTLVINVIYGFADAAVK